MTLASLIVKSNVHKTQMDVPPIGLIGVNLTAVAGQGRMNALGIKFFCLRFVIANLRLFT